MSEDKLRPNLREAVTCESCVNYSEDHCEIGESVVMVWLDQVCDEHQRAKISDGGSVSSDDGGEA